MQIRITRHRKTLETIDGSLSIDNSVRLCDTAENAVTALPAGSYRMGIVKCRQYGRKMPVVQPVDACTPASAIRPSAPAICRSCKKFRQLTHNSPLPRVCPMLKPGNGVWHRADGSILVGTRICSGCLKLSRKSFGQLYERIRKSMERGNEVTLQIIDA